MADRSRTRTARGHDRRTQSRQGRQSQVEQEEFNNEYDAAEPTDDYDEGDDNYESDNDRDEYDEEPARGGSQAAGTRMSVAEIAEAGLRQIAEITSKSPAGVTSVEPAEAGWVVGVEVVEDRRVPSSADILALYEAEIGTDGALLSYRRTKRYPRGRGDDGGAGG